MKPTNPFLKQAPVKGIARIFVVGSGKGGVGKSTVAVNLAYALKHRGRRVGLLDADIYGPSLPRMTGTAHLRPQIDERSQLTPIEKFGLKIMSMGYLVDESAAVVWRGPMLFKAIDQFFSDVAWGELDELIIDLPPGTGDVALTIAQKVPVNGSIVVCTPQNIALADAKKALDMFERINIPLLGVVENMAFFTPPGTHERVQLFPRGELDTFLTTKKMTKLCEIPFDPNVGIAGEAGIPVVQSQPESLESQAFLTLADAVLSAPQPTGA
jgi:ATP-binding protein involved in chromosome partitioning